MLGGNVGERNRSCMFDVAAVGDEEDDEEAAVDV